MVAAARNQRGRGVGRKALEPGFAAPVGDLFGLDGKAAA
jgi:hypothetical protein